LAAECSVAVVGGMLTGLDDAATAGDEAFDVRELGAA
jgi:hypothetical protein